MKEQINVFELNAEIYGVLSGGGEPEILFAAVNKMNFEEITAQARVMLGNGDAETVINYVEPSRFTGSVKELFWALAVSEAALPFAETLPTPVKSALYHNYITLLSIYVSNVYNPELLNSGDVRVLSAAHRFGYYMSEAEKRLADSDRAGYVGNLKKALSADKSKADIVSMLVDEL
ncbi:MAG: hypothetical protein LBI38_01995 [Oscillospiraceae bacterium]|jgi:hypothetical protein|nr:hypothetical protein [Oscillospiraceae bacterium]